MEKRNLTIINRTKFKTKDIEEIALGLLAGQLAPSFYLDCSDEFLSSIGVMPDSYYADWGEYDEEQ